MEENVTYYWKINADLFTNEKETTESQAHTMAATQVWQALRDMTHFLHSSYISTDIVQSHASLLIKYSSLIQVMEQVDRRVGS